MSRTGAQAGLSLRRAGGSLSLLAAAVIWGFSYVVAAAAARRTDALFLTFYRYVLAAAGMLAAVWLCKIRISGTVLRKSWLLGLLLSMSQYIQVSAAGYSTPGKISFITAAYVVWVPPLEAVFERKRLTLRSVGLSLLTLLALSLLYDLRGAVNRGDVLAVFGSLGFAAHILCSERALQTQPAEPLAAMQFAWGAIFSGALLLLKEGTLRLEQTDTQLWLEIGYLGAFSTLAGFLLQMLGQRRVPAGTASILLSTEAVFGLLFSVLAGKETLTVKSMISFALISCAVWLTQTKKNTDERVYEVKK